MNTPPITVLMPAYNAEKYIAEAITSVLAQTFSNFELLIVNDGSTDNTENIIRSFADNRIKLISQTNQGVASALNTGILAAAGTYIARFDADDICYPRRLEKQFAFFSEHPDYVLAGTDAEYLDMDGNYVFSLNYPAYSDEEIRKLPQEICAFSHVTVMYKKETAIQAGLYDKNAHSFEDHLLWHKIMQKGKICNLKEILVKVRFNPESLTIDDRWRGTRFKQLKNTVIEKGEASAAEGEEIQQIICRQNKARIKKGAYYSLLAKKYMFNNYNRARAWKSIKELIQTNPLKPQGYLLLGISLLPPSFLQKLYKIK